MRPSYRRCISQLHNWFWSQPIAEAVKSKRHAKELVRERGIIVPQDIPLPKAFVLKPDNQHSSRGVIAMNQGQLLIGEYPVVIAEELIEDELGMVPPRTFHLFCFGGDVRMVQVHQHNRDGENFRAYHRLPCWTPMTIDPSSPPLITKPPSSLVQMVQHSRNLSSLFPCPIRIDWFAGLNGPVFNEFCATPGITNRINNYGDELLGQWFESDMSSRERA